MKTAIIGIVGRIGCGKTTVARLFERLGANVLYADKIVHKLLDTEMVKKALLERWGNHIFNSKGKLCRDKLAKIVFSSKKQLRKLENIIHPKVIAIMDKKIKAWKKKGWVIVIDAPLLLESKYKRCCDKIIYIGATTAICRSRIKKGRRWGHWQINRRQSFQVSLNKKRSIADYVIYNSGAIQHTFEQVKKIYNKIVCSN